MDWNVCRLPLCWELEYFHRALFSSTGLEIDCRRWLVLPRCANSDLPFSFSVFSIVGEWCCMHFLLWSTVWYCIVIVIFLSARLSAFILPFLLSVHSPLVIQLNCILLNVSFFFFLHFNCLRDIYMHEANACEASWNHLPHALNLKTSITEKWPSCSLC